MLFGDGPKSPLQIANNRGCYPKIPGYLHLGKAGLGAKVADPEICLADGGEVCRADAKHLGKRKE